MRKDETGSICCMQRADDSVLEDFLGRGVLQPTVRNPSGMEFASQDVPRTRLRTPRMTKHAP
jgi:hypothetical protein